MKDNLAYLAYGLVWLSMAIVVSVAIYITKSAMPLWFMILPATLSVKSSKD